MNVNIEFEGRGVGVFSSIEGERCFVAGIGVLPPSSVTGVNWVEIIALSSLAKVRAMSEDDRSEIVCHSSEGNVEGNRLKADIGRNYRILTPGDMITLGRPGERQIVITGRA